MGTKRSVLPILFLALTLLVLLSSSSVATASLDLAGGLAQPGYEVRLPDTDDATIDYSAITEVIGNYFACYYRSLENLSVVPELGHYVADTDDTHLSSERCNTGSTGANSVTPASPLRE